MTEASTSPPHSMTAEEFSLEAGGPLYQLLFRSRLLRPPLELVERRIAFFVMLVYLPLLVLSFVEGRASGGVRIPFLQDWDAHVRLLFSLPLLIYAEKLVHERLRIYIGAFVEAEVVTAADRGRFDALLASTLRMRNSAVVEVLLVAFVWTVGRLLWADDLAVHEPTWFATPREGSLGLTPAGVWYAWFSVPVFQFLLFRWWYRLVLWWLLLFRISRLDLHLSPTHPDGLCGLEFLGTSAASFTPLLAAQTALAASMIAGRIVHEGAQLPDFQVEIAMAVGFALLQVLGPLFVFTPKLVAARRHGLHEFGLMAGRYSRGFERKWLGERTEGHPALVGSDDIQGLAALHASLEVINEIRPIPFSKETLFELLVTCGLPLFPLISTVVPADELVGRLLETLF